MPTRFVLPPTGQAFVPVPPIVGTHAIAELEQRFLADVVEERPPETPANDDNPPKRQRLQLGICKEVASPVTSYVPTELVDSPSPQSDVIVPPTSILTSVRTEEEPTQPLPSSTSPSTSPTAPAQVDISRWELQPEHKQNNATGMI